MKVLFVCSGNICRSPMAAEYCRDRASRSGLSHLVVDSAGLLGIEGALASDEAIEVLRREGLDLSAHRSRGLRASDVKTSDLILVMTLEHLEALEARFPDGPGERLLLRAFEGGSAPIAGAPPLEDPIGQDMAVYEDRFATIRSCVDHLILHLRHRAP